MYFNDIVSSLIGKFERSASVFGLSADDLRSAGNLAAVKATRSWVSTGGRSLPSWVWANVDWTMKHELERARYRCTQELSEDSAESAEFFDVDSAVTVKASLGFLQAELSTLEWTTLWFRYAEGYSVGEIAEKTGYSTRHICRVSSRGRQKAVSILASHRIAWTGAINAW